MPDLLTGRHDLPDGDLDAVLVHVQVGEGDRSPVDGAQDLDRSGTTVHAGVQHLSIGGRKNRGARGGGVVGAFMELGMPGDRVGALSERRRDHPRPGRQREHHSPGLRHRGAPAAVSCPNHLRQAGGGR